MLHAMFDIFAPIETYAREVYDRVMGNDKIKNKFFGYFWRVAAIYAALFGVAFGLVTLLSGGGMWKSIPMAGVLGTVLIVLIICAGYPVVSFRRVSRKSKNAEKDS